MEVLFILETLTLYHFNDGVEKNNPLVLQPSSLYDFTAVNTLARLEITVVIVNTIILTGGLFAGKVLSYYPALLSLHGSTFLGRDVHTYGQ